MIKAAKDREIGRAMASNVCKSMVPRERERERGSFCK